MTKRKPHSRSDRFAWDTSRKERYFADGIVYDVQKAKEFIAAAPRAITKMDTKVYGASIEAWMKTATLKANVDWSKVDVRIPVILAQSERGIFPIDGRHRIRKALNERSAFYTVELTPEETSLILVKS